MMTDYPWAQPKTVAEWRDRVINSLGGYHFNAELDQPTLDHAIRQTLTLFNKFRPNWEWLPLGEMGDLISEFDLSDQISIGVSVSDVKFVSADQFLPHATPSPFSAVNPIEYFGMRYHRRSYKRLMALERYKFFTGSHPTWRWVASEQKLYITNRGYQTIYASALLLVPLKLEEIPFHLEYDFLEGAIGFTKRVLARILGKFGPIPAAQGQITTDAATLRTEADTAIKELDRKLDRNLRHSPPRPIF